MGVNGGLGSIMAVHSSSPNSLTAAVLTDVYTCPASRNVRISVVFANRTAVATTIRLAAAADDAADHVSQYILYDTPLAANGTITIDDISIQEGGIIRAWAAAAGVSVNVFVNELGAAFI